MGRNMKYVFVIGVAALVSICGSGMVLHRDTPVPIWGIAEPGQKITVTFAGQTKIAITDASGKWLVHLAPMKAASTPQKLTIKGSGQPIEFGDVLIGEVWLVLTNKTTSLYRTESPPPYPANRIRVVSSARGRPKFSNTPQVALGRNEPWKSTHGP